MHVCKTKKSKKKRNSSPPPSTSFANVPVYPWPCPCTMTNHDVLNLVLQLYHGSIAVLYTWPVGNWHIAPARRTQKFYASRARRAHGGLTVYPFRIPIRDVATPYPNLAVYFKLWFSMIRPSLRRGNVPSFFPLKFTVLVLNLASTSVEGFDAFDACHACACDSIRQGLAIENTKLSYTVLLLCISNSTGIGYNTAR